MDYVYGLRVFVYISLKRTTHYRYDRYLTDSQPYNLFRTDTIPTCTLNDRLPSTTSLQVF